MKKGTIALMLIFTLFASAVAVSLIPKTSWVIIPYRDTETKNLTFTIESGKYYDVNFHLYSGYSVNFSFTTTGILNVSLMDSENYEKYERGEQYTVILNIFASSTRETYTGNYTAMRTDTYHLVFENVFLFSATVNLTVSWEVLKFLPVPYRS